MTEGCFVFLNVARIHSLLSDHYDRHKWKFSIILNVKNFTNGMVSLVLSIGKSQEWWTPFGWGRGQSTKNNRVYKLVRFETVR